MQPIPHVCAKCGADFNGKRNRTYCSRECHHADRGAPGNKGAKGGKGKPKSRVAIICVGCGRASETHRYRLRNGTGKYCSQACYLAHRWAKDGKCGLCGTPCGTRFCTPLCQKTFWNRSGYRIHAKK